MFEIPVDEEIILKRITMASAPRIFEGIDKNREHLRHWAPFVDATSRVSDTESFIRSVTESNFPKKDLIFEIFYTGAFAGLIALKEVDHFNNKTELGYWLTAEHTRKGIVTRSATTLIDYAFSELGMNRVQIKVAIGNTRSTLVPERLGFKFEGIERNGERLTDRYADLLVYSLLKNEWEK